MKLLLCLNCYDVFKLARETRSCSCGAAKGRYIDRLHAETNGEGVCLAIDNNSLRAALMRGVQGNPEVRCWARPHEGESNPNTAINRDL